MLSIDSNLAWFIINGSDFPIYEDDEVDLKTSFSSISFKNLTFLNASICVVEIQFDPK